MILELSTPIFPHKMHFDDTFSIQRFSRKIKLQHVNTFCIIIRPFLFCDGFKSPFCGLTAATAELKGQTA